MSDDEGFVLLISSAVALMAWGRLWFGLLRQRKRLRASGFARGLLLGLPLVVAIALTAMLKSWADVGVRESTAYLAFYVVFGLAWLGASFPLVERLGVSVRDDVLERNNVPAALTLYGMLVGLTLAFAGGNFGDGPGWWVVVFSAGMGVVALSTLWVALEKLTWIVDRVTIDRNAGAAVHAALLWIAWGAIAMRASAGNWVDAPQAVADFLPALVPMAGLLVLAIFVERVLRPQRAIGSVALPVSLATGLVEVGCAVAWVVWKGWW